MARIEDWKLVLQKAWSIKLSLLAAVLSASEVALPFFTDFVPPRTMALLAVLAASGAAISRVIAQPVSMGEAGK